MVRINNQKPTQITKNNPKKLVKIRIEFSFFVTLRENSIFI